MNEPICIHVARNPIDAKIVVAMLQGEGIPAYAEGDMPNDTFSLSQQMLNLRGTRIIVPASSRELAASILANARTIDDAELAAQALAAVDEPGETSTPLFRAPAPSQATATPPPLAATSWGIGRLLLGALGVLGIVIGVMRPWQPSGPPTEQEVLALALAMQRAVAANDLVSILDCWSSLSYGDSFVPDSADGTVASKSAVPIPVELQLEWKPPATYELLRLQTRDGVPTPLFRGKDADGVFDYHWLELARVDGEVKVVDIESLRLGTYVRYFIRGAGQANSIDHMLSLRSFEAAHHEQQWSAMVASYDKLPAALKDDAEVLIDYCDAALRAENIDAFRAGMGRYSNLHTPTRPFDFLATYVSSLGNGKVSREAFERIETLVGGDAFLANLRRQIPE